MPPAWNGRKILAMSADEAGDIWGMGTYGSLVRLRDGTVLADAWLPDLVRLGDEVLDDEEDDEGEDEGLDDFDETPDVGAPIHARSVQATRPPDGG